MATVAGPATSGRWPGRQRAGAGRAGDERAQAGGDERALAGGDEQALAGPATSGRRPAADEQALAGGDEQALAGGR
jgi:hypothetical protein